MFKQRNIREECRYTEELPHGKLYGCPHQCIFAQTATVPQKLERFPLKLDVIKYSRAWEQEERNATNIKRERNARGVRREVEKDSPGTQRTCRHVIAWTLTHHLVTKITLAEVFDRHPAHLAVFDATRIRQNVEDQATAQM